MITVSPSALRLALLFRILATQNKTFALNFRTFLTRYETVAFYKKLSLPELEFLLPGIRFSPSALRLALCFRILATQHETFALNVRTFLPRYETFAF